MRVLNWALDAQKTVGGKIISVILSVALIFSFSNFFYGDNAFADTEEDTKSELVDQVSDKPAEENSEVVVPAKQTEQKPAAKAATPQVKPQANHASLDELNEAFLAVGEALESGIIQAGIAAIDNFLSVYNNLSAEDKAANTEAVEQAKAYRENLVAAQEAEKSNKEYNDPDIELTAEHSYNVYVYMALEYTNSISNEEQAEFVSKLGSQGYVENGSTTHNWFTLGMVSNVAGIPDSTKQKVGATASNPIKSLENITAHKGNKPLINYVTTIPSTIFVAKGANDYINDDKSSSKTYTWHLNTYASVVKYTWVDGYSDDPIIQTTVDFSKATPQAPSNPTRKGYEFTGWKESTNNGDVTYTAQWKKDLTLTAENGGGVYNANAYYLNNVKASLEGATIEYKIGDGEWTTTAPSATNVADSAQNISVRAMLEGYEPVQVDNLSITVTPAEVTVTAGNATKVYGTSDPSFEATVEGLVPADATNTSLIQYSIAREAGEDVGTYAITAAGDEIQGNYKVTYAPGTLTIVPQSIDPNDPTQPTDPTDPTTDPNQPVYNNAQVNNPENVVYNAQSQQQPIEVTDSEGNIIDPSNYTVDYTEAVNAGTVTVTITGQGNYAGSVTRTYQITPAPVTITVNDATKVAGAADPTFTGQVTEGQIYNNELGDITFTRTNGDQATGTYADVLTANYAANSNYAVTVVPGTFTITAAPAPAPAPAPTPTPAPAAAPATPAAAPAAPAAAPAAPAVVIPDEENPLAAPEQEIADDENPLAAFDHEECWVHWFMIAGILLTIIYGAVVVLRRTRNTKYIDKMEKDLIGTTDESTVTVGSAHHSHA